MNAGKDGKAQRNGCAAQESHGTHVALSAWPVADSPALSQSQSVGLMGRSLHCSSRLGHVPATQPESPSRLQSPQRRCALLIRVVSHLEGKLYLPGPFGVPGDEGQPEVKGNTKHSRADSSPVLKAQFEFLVLAMPEDSALI